MNARPSAVIVDQSQSFLMYLSVLLNRMNLEVLPVTCVDEALEVARVTRPKLMTMDLLMPERDGLDALRSLRTDEELGDLPVIIISGCRDKRMKWEAESLGCVDVLDKPVDLFRLHRALQRCNLYKGRRRRYLRAAFGKPVDLIVNATAQTLTGVTLSERGVFIRMRTPLAKGTRVEVVIPATGEQRLHVGGRVVYTKEMNGGQYVSPSGIAIKFDRITARDAATLSAVVSGLLVSDLDQDKTTEIFVS